MKNTNSLSEIQGALFAAVQCAYSKGALAMARNIANPEQRESAVRGCEDAVTDDAQDYAILSKGLCEDAKHILDMIASYPN